MVYCVIKLSSTFSEEIHWYSLECSRHVGVPLWHTGLVKFAFSSGRVRPTLTRLNNTGSWLYWFCSYMEKAVQGVLTKNWNKLNWIVAYAYHNNMTRNCGYFEPAHKPADFLIAVKIQNGGSKDAACSYGGRWMQYLNNWCIAWE